MLFLAKRAAGYLKALACIAVLSGALFAAVAEARGPLPVQTDVDDAQHVIAADGVPSLSIKDVGTYHNPAWVALYALAYAGVETYDDTEGVGRDPEKFRATVGWLAKNLIANAHGDRVWLYEFDNTYNDVSIKAPWWSAFGQATGIQALVASYRLDGNQEHLRLAQQAAEVLFKPVEDGGLLFRKGSDIWFEEIPLPADNPPHILNGHMRVLLALRELAQATGEDKYQKWFDQGASTLERWLPLYDTGYWFRYDLNPRKDELLFRLANPYGYPVFPVAIDRLTLRDPVSKKEVTIDVGAAGDADGSQRIAGTEWGAAETVAGRTARRLAPGGNTKSPGEAGGDGESPHTYFYLTLPGAWQDNLRNKWYELVVDYFDEEPANLAVQMRSIAPGIPFRDLRDGDLHLTGAGHWRRWIVPVRVSDLGFWVGESYADKHARYLRKLAEGDSRFASWAYLGAGYQGLAMPTAEACKVAVAPVPITMPKQTPVVPVLSLDRSGVVMQHFADDAVRWNADGTFDPKGGAGRPSYSPYLIAQQVLFGKDLPGAEGFGLDPSRLRTEPALDWLLNSKHYRTVNSAHVYDYDFGNVYNDVVTEAPWPSAFGQAYVVKALRDVVKQHGRPDVQSALVAAAKAYRIDVSEGGITTTDRAGFRFFEEVPNATHVLNAHLVSIPELGEASRTLNDKSLKVLMDEGVATLRERLHLFDAGYWLRYDQNPRKELLVQLDWLKGQRSPQIEEVRLLNPATGQYVSIDVGGSGGDADGAQISGTEWLPSVQADGRWVREFANGYQIRRDPLAGGARHNVFLRLPVPPQEVANLFDMVPYKLVVRYRDIAEGRFSVKMQAIDSGDHLAFVPLRGGILHTTGDEEWKQASFIIRPQDLGWYKGKDYQAFEVEQLQRIANLTNDWFFYQYAERNNYFAGVPSAGEQLSARVAHGRGQLLEKVSLEAATPTYPGFGFENALDGDAYDDYTAGVEGGEQYVILALGRPADLEAIAIEWESDKNYSKSITVTDMSPGAGGQPRVLAARSGLAPPVSWISLEGADQIKAIRIDFRDYEGQPRALLRQIRLFEHDSSQKPMRQFVRRAEAAAKTGPENSIFLGPKDKRNPLRVFRMPISQKIRQLADKLAEGAGSDHEKVMRFMKYISAFRVGIASGSTPDATIEERIGACGTFTNTLLAMAASQGLEGRIVSLLNSPKNDGHAVAEIYLEGQWRLYDPTYFGYYVLAGHVDMLPLSHEQILDNYHGDPNSVELVANIYRPGIEKFTGRTLFLDADPAGEIGLDKPMLFPLSLDLRQQKVLEERDFGPRFQGANYLGAAGPNQNQRWTLSGLVSGREYVFSITPKNIGGELAVGDRRFNVSAKIVGGEPRSALQHSFDFAKGQADPWAIRFAAQADTVVLELQHPYRGPEIRYMQVARYELNAVN